MSNFEKFSNQEIPENVGVERLYKFLEKTGFTEVISDTTHFQEWVNQLSFEEFQKHLVRLNGIVREVSITEREVDGENVRIGNEIMGVDFLPPYAEDKEGLLQEAFEKLRTMDNIEDQGLLLYLTIQYLHLFNDGNGRLGRLLYYLINKAKESSRITVEEIRGLLSHNGESGPGRNLFYEEVKPPSVISNIVNIVMAREILSEDFLKQYKRSFPDDLMAGRIDIENNNIEPEIKSKLELVLSETGGMFSFRDFVMLKYMEDHGLLGEYEIPLGEDEIDKEMIYRYDANRLLSSISEVDAQEMLEISRNIKRKFIEKLIDMISEPEKYNIKGEEKTVKDLFYTKD